MRRFYFWAFSSRIIYSLTFVTLNYDEHRHIDNDNASKRWYAKSQMRIGKARGISEGSWAVAREREREWKKETEREIEAKALLLGAGTLKSACVATESSAAWLCKPKSTSRNTFRTARTAARLAWLCAAPYCCPINAILVAKAHLPFP